MNKMEILPFPYGKQFAVTFVDDTDFSTKVKIKPVYDFLYDMGMRGTKTVWVMRQKRTSSCRAEYEVPIKSGQLFSGSTTEDRDYLSFILDLKEKGFEIALHNVSAGNSYREEILSGIDRFKQIFGHNPIINAFHKTNIENLYAGIHKLDFPLFKILEKVLHNSEYQGHVEGSPYFWGDVYLRRIKYTRLPFHNISEINTLKVNPSMPFFDRRRPLVRYWFASSDGADCERYIRLLSTNNIERLRKERGACVVYTHFSKGFSRKTNNGYILNEKFMSVMENLATYPDAWFPTCSQLLDWLLARKKISVKRENGTLTISNRGDKSIKGLSFKTTKREIPLGGITHYFDDRGILIIPDLPPKQSLSLRTDESVKSYICQSNSKEIGRREHIRIEFYNYIGLLINDIIKPMIADLRHR